MLAIGSLMLDAHTRIEAAVVRACDNIMDAVGDGPRAKAGKQRERMRLASEASVQREAVRKALWQKEFDAVRKANPNASDAFCAQWVEDARFMSEYFPPSRKD